MKPDRIRSLARTPSVLARWDVLLRAVVPALHRAVPAPGEDLVRARVELHGADRLLVLPEQLRGPVAQGPKLDLQAAQIGQAVVFFGEPNCRDSRSHYSLAFDEVLEVRGAGYVAHRCLMAGQATVFFL